MTRSTNMEHVAHLQRMANESWIGSPERAALDAAIASLSAPQPPAEAQPVAKLVNRKDADGGKTTTFIRPTSLGMDLPLGEYPLHLRPSAPVGVEALRDLRDRVLPAALRHHAHGPGYIEEAQEIVTRALAQQPAAAGPVWMGIDWAEGQQPAADGGFTAADMMDARQEGRKEAQQPGGSDNDR